MIFPGCFLVCLPCLLAIRVESSGNPLFVQQRVGKGQKGFFLFKLRTMSNDTEQRASHEISSSKITRVGRFLRRTKIDEFPQVINVLKGDMSFVGPRPCLPSQSELIEARQALGVFDIRPGITGPAQIAGIDMSTPEKLARADADYMKNRSFLGDLKLMVLTAKGSGSGDAVDTISD